jgi:hypothetical protein
MKATFILFLIFSFSIAVAQDEFAKGYIKMPKKDTMKGEIKLAIKNDMDYYSKVYFRQNPKVKPKQFLPNKINAYGYDGKHFAAMKFMDQWVFMQVICAGKISVYEYKPPVTMGNEAKESIYIVMKGGADEMSELDPKGKFKKQLKPLFSDDKGILKELDKKDLDFKMALELISKYNTNNL